MSRESAPCTSLTCTCYVPVPVCLLVLPAAAFSPRPSPWPLRGSQRLPPAARLVVASWFRTRILTRSLTLFLFIVVNYVNCACDASRPCLCPLGLSLSLSLSRGLSACDASCPCLCQCALRPRLLSLLRTRPVSHSSTRSAPPSSPTRLATGDVATTDAATTDAATSGRLIAPAPAPLPRQRRHAHRGAERARQALQRLRCLGMLYSHRGAWRGVPPIVLMNCCLRLPIRRCDYRLRLRESRQRRRRRQALRSGEWR